MSEPTQAVARRPATPVDQVKSLINGPQFRDRVIQALPRHCTADRFLQVALTCLNKTPALANCTQESLFSAFLTLSSLGLEPDGRRAHLIPFGQTVTVIVDYKGLVELVMRSGEVSKIHADVVCEADDFEYDRGVINRHKIDFRKDRGQPYAAYAMVTMRATNDVACAVMGRAEIEAVRKRSRSPNSGPWVTDWAEMAKKTVFRRLTKWLSLSPELREQIEKDDDPTDQPQTTVTINDRQSDDGFAPAPAAGLQALPAPTQALVQADAPKRRGRPPKNPVVDVPVTPAPAPAGPPTTGVFASKPAASAAGSTIERWCSENGITLTEIAEVLDQYGMLDQNPDENGIVPPKRGILAFGDCIPADWVFIERNAEAIKAAIQEVRQDSAGT